MTGAAAPATRAASSAGATDERSPLTRSAAARLSSPPINTTFRRRFATPCRSPQQPEHPGQQAPDRPYQAPQHAHSQPSCSAVTSRPASRRYTRTFSVRRAGLEPARQILAPAGLDLADVAPALHAELGARPLECAKLLRAG